MATYYPRAFTAGTLTRWFLAPYDVALGASVDPVSLGWEEITQSEYEAAGFSCEGSGTAPVSPGITIFFLQYDTAGLAAVVRASVATEVRLTRPDGVTVPNEGIFRATNPFNNPPALPEAGTYNYIWPNLLAGVEYLVTLRPAGSANASLYQTQRYTLPGTPAPAPSSSPILAVVPGWDATNGLYVYVNTSEVSQVRAVNTTGSFGNNGFLSLDARVDGAAPPASGTYVKFYGAVPGGVYNITARKTGETDETKWRTASITVGTPAASTIKSGYVWKADRSFRAVAAVSDSATYQFYLEPLDGQTPPIGSFQFIPMGTVSETVAGVAVNRAGQHGATPGVAPGRWNLHVQKVGQPETRDTREILLIGGFGDEADVGEGPSGFSISGPGTIQSGTSRTYALLNSGTGTITWSVSQATGVSIVATSTGATLTNSTATSGFVIITATQNGLTATRQVTLTGVAAPTVTYTLGNLYEGTPIAIVPKITRVVRGYNGSRLDYYVQASNLQNGTIYRLDERHRPATNNGVDVWSSWSSMKVTPPYSETGASAYGFSGVLGAAGTATQVEFRIVDDSGNVYSGQTTLHYDYTLPNGAQSNVVLLTT